MTDLWLQPGFPKKGWVCVDIEDLKDDDEEDYSPGTCEACGRDDLRYLHIMEHDDYDGNIEVGCVCAGKLEQDYAAAKQRARRFVNRQKRRERWLTRYWRVSRKRNEYLNIEGYNVGVYKRYGIWQYWIRSINTGAHVGNGSRYNSSREAKLALFDALADHLGW